MEKYFKEEFVTAGGINLKEINFKTMESKLHENLYFAEIVNIDAITVDLTPECFDEGLFWRIVFSELLSVFSVIYVIMLTDKFSSYNLSVLT
jgi:hypothetical protein